MARTGNRTTRRQQLNMRVTDEIRAKLEAAAEAAGRNLTQEVEWRIEQSFEWERAFGEVRAYLTEQKIKIDEATGANLEAEMRKRGWKPIVGSPYWAKPGTFPNAKSGFIDPEKDEAPMLHRVEAPSPAAEPVRPVATVDLRSLIEETVERVLARTGRGAAIVPAFQASAAGEHDKQHIGAMRELRALLGAAVSLMDEYAPSGSEQDLTGEKSK